MKKATLSKTSYIKSVQCQKQLFLYKNHYHLKDPLSFEKRAIFSRGNKVGLFAQKLFPGGKDATPKNPKDQKKWIENTNKFIDLGINVIYEAAFIYNDVFAAIDILVKKDDNWYAYEVKSSARITPVYISDAALQYYVISNHGIKLADISIIYINTSYVKSNVINLKKIFHVTSVLKHAEKQKKKIESNISAARSTLNQNTIPEISIGTHCFDPYQCDFKGLCWKNITSNSVFEIAGLSKSEHFKLYNAGIKSPHELPEDLKLNKLATVHVKSNVTGKAHIDSKKIKKFLSGISYPIYYIDFESFMPAIPLFNNSSPFQALPFQFSIHYKENKDSELKHADFLAESGVDPREKFLVNFLKFTQNPGTILAYDISGERNSLESLIKLFPEYASEIRQRIKRLKDLNTPFSELMYYHYAMKGSNSLKTVLNSLFNRDFYEGIEIKNGNMASVAYESLHSEADIFEIATRRDNLLEYCKMDTFGMVKIFDWLESL